MVLAGLQKLTLLDYPGKVACIVYTAGCNFRCPYCHNASLVLPGREAGALPEEELLAFLQKRRGLLEGVVVTGGEPLLHEELPALLRRIRALGYAVKLDTNGSRPRYLRAVVEAGLADYVAMDVKNAPALYAATAGTPELDMDAVTESRDLLLSGAVDYEFRTTVVRGLHTRESLAAAAAWIAGARRYYLQTFRDSGDLVAGAGLGAFDEAELRDFLGAVRRYVPDAALRGV